MKIKIYFILFILVLGSSLYAKENPYVQGNGDNSNHQIPQPFSVTAQLSLSGNNIKAFMWNTGVFNQNLAVQNTPGFNWPKYTNTYAWFTSGLSIGCIIGGNIRLATASYKGEYSPGYVLNGAFTTDSRFRLYKISPLFQFGNSDPSNTDNNFDTWADYAQMIPFGAPYVDINNNGVYDPGVDLPGINNATQTMFCCLTDADPNTHSNSEGFSGGTLPIKAEVHFTSWAYNGPGLTDLYFVQWATINKNNIPWNSTYFAIVNDPDLGFSDDDYVGCDIDTSGGGKPHNLGYVWNATNNDAGNSYAYGNNPPAAGQDFFLSPIIPTGNQSDTVQIYNPPGSNNRIVKHGFRELGLTSFNFFTNPSTPGGTCERDPSTPSQAYNYMKGVKSDGTPILDASQNPPVITKYCYPGDPESGTGWTELVGNIRNCGGELTGTVITPSPPGDRRFIFNSGADDFTVNPNDTQYIVLSQLVARGSSNKNSVTRLKQLDVVAQKIFDLNFHVIPPPPIPKVSVSTNPNSNVGTCDIILSWTDTSETYHFYDNIYNTGYYNFQGYEVYEVKKTANTYPDPLKPETMNSDVSLLKIYDLRDNFGSIFDSLSNGYQLTTFPIVPAYTLSAPSGFPNVGITRSVRLTRTSYPQLNGNVDKFVYGNSYKFMVVAYAYDSNGVPSGKVIRNAFSSAVFSVTPEAPPAGTQFTYKNGDTLFTNRRDLGVMPIVMNQDAVKDAKYRIIYNSPDTTYNILRSFDNGASFQQLKSGLKNTNFAYGKGVPADDSSKIIDGILFKTQAIRYISETPPGNYSGNFGVIADANSKTRDSIETRLSGWDYSPASNRNLEGSKYLLNGRLWQSQQMSISYPNRNTYIGLKTQLNPEDCRTVKIVFTGYGSGQQAYRFLATSAINYTYQDMQEVPFKVYEIEPNDGSAAPRQLNCAFLEFPDFAQDNKWSPTADSLGGKDILYIFNSDYSTEPNTNYTTRNLFINQPLFDIMYVWAAKLINNGATFNANDVLTIYPYNVTRPEISAGNPLFYDIDTKMPLVGNTNVATSNSDLDKITVVPNPYYGFNNLETSSTGRFVTFRRLPLTCSIKIYTLNGDLIRKLDKNDQASTTTWDMKNFDGVPIASGIYIALIDAPGIGNKVVKVAIFTPQERIDF